jgi:hypothetical protein
MTLHFPYLDNARSAGTALTEATKSWTDTMKGVAGQARPAFTVVNPTTVITRWIDGARQLQQANLDYGVDLLRAASVAGDAVGQHIDRVSSLIRDQFQALTGAVHEQVDKAEQVAHEQAERAEQAEREQAREARRLERQQARQAEAEQAEREAAEKERARQARAAERQQAREAHEAARQRYEGKTKAELADELSARDLPKTGNVDELIERLVDADTQ